MEKALRSFAAKGFHGTTIREIAKACGITQAVLYQHFASKEDIYLEAQRQARDDALATWRKEVEEAPNAFEAFRGIIMRQAEIFGRDSSMGSLFIHGMGATTINRTYRNLMENWFNEQHNFLISLLEAGIEDGSIKNNTDIDFVLWQLRGLLFGLLTSSVLDFKLGIDQKKCTKYLNKILSSIS